MPKKKTPPRPLPYDDVIPLEKVQDWLYRRTGTLVKEPWIRKQVRSRALRTITRPRRYGGGTFTRVAWLEDLISRYS